MGFIDILLILIVAGFVFFGLFFGLVHTLGSLIGAVVGIVLASRLVDPAFHTFGFLFGSGAMARIILFVIIFFLITRVIGVIFWFVGKVFDVLAWIPFARTFDRLLGALFGFIEGIMVVGVVLFYAMQVLPPDTLRFALETSAVAKYLIAMMSALQVFFPDLARQAIQTSTITTVPLPDVTPVE